MFDIGWSELVLVGVVALIAIGPKELPGVLRMVGQWMGKARKMAAEFQGQFQEAMREAEMADLKKSFDEVKEAASGFTGTNHLMTSLQKDVSDALRVDALDKPAETSAAPAIEAPATSSEALAASGEAAATSSEAPATSSEAPVTPTTPEVPTPATFMEAEAHAAANEPLAISREVEQAPVAQDTGPSDAIKDAKAS